MTSKPIRRTVAAALTCMALAPSVGGAGPATAASTKTIRLKDDFFAPAATTVRRGTKVRFKWVGFNPHNVVKASGPGGRFASRTTWRRGFNFAKKFRKVGEYRLICTIHSGMEMKLTVVR